MKFSFKINRYTVNKSQVGNFLFISPSELGRGKKLYMFSGSTALLLPHGNPCNVERTILAIKSLHFLHFLSHRTGT